MIGEKAADLIKASRTQQTVTHIPHPQLSQSEITEIKKQNLYKKGHFSQKRDSSSDEPSKTTSKPILNKQQ